LALCIIIPCIAVWLVRRIWPYPTLKENNEIVGFTYAVFGLIYGVLLAFTIVVAWGRFSETERVVVHETTILSELWRDSQAFDPTTSNKIHKHLLAYTESVIRDEWPEMAARCNEHAQSRSAYSQLWKDCYSLQPLSKVQEACLAEYLHNLNELSAARRMRILYSRSEIQGVFG